MKRFFLYFSLICNLTPIIAAQETYTYLNRNHISTGFFNNGISDINASGSNSGLEYPKYSRKTAVYSSGFIWGTKIAGDPIPHVGGSTYRSGLQPGRITNSGLPWRDLLTAELGMFRVRSDVFPGGPNIDLIEEAIIEGKTEQEIRTQYETDWNEWPAEFGAPYTDKNGDGIYNPQTDIPGYPGAEQTIWYAANDLDSNKTTNLYGTLPIGIEVQVTIWNYLNYEPLNHVYFKHYKLINKSNTTFDTTYISIWIDPDLGDATDDFAGCDSLLNFGFAYNGDDHDNIYGFTPPAYGVKLIKGPTINSTSLLSMTAFYYFAAPGDASVVDPTLGSAQGARQYYNFMQGKIGLTGSLFIDPITNQPTSFALNGDPITQTGWVDGLLLPSGARKLGICSGPFNMAPNDTQVVITSVALGLGTDRINSFKLLKYHSELSSQLFAGGFTNSPKIPSPKLEVVQQNNNFLLKWESDTALVNSIENFNRDGYQFQGYNVYQFSADMSLEGISKRLATFDVIDSITQINGFVMNSETGLPEQGVVYSGSNSGIQREFLAVIDSIYNTYFIPGKKYYFAVTAYGYNSNPSVLPNTVESFLNLIEVTFEDTSVWANFGNVLQVTQIAGIGDAVIKPTVVDPYQLTNHSYKIFFTNLGDTLKWNLRDMTLGTDILTNQTDFTGDYTSPIVDGLQLRVKIDQGFRQFSVISNASGIIIPPQPGAFGSAGFPTPGNADPIAGLQQAMNNSVWAIHTADNGFRGTYDAFLTRTSRDGASWEAISQNDYEIRFTQTGGWAYDAFNTGTLSFHVQFELWNIGKNTPDNIMDDYRMIPWLYDDDGSGTFNMGVPGSKKTGTFDHSISSGDDDPYTDWIYWMRPENTTPGQTGYFEAEAKMVSQTYDGGNDFEVMARMVLVCLNGGTAPPYIADLPETGTIFRIETTKLPVAGVDEFTFQNSVLSVNDNDILDSYSLSQNYPNPFNPTTTIQFSLEEKINVELSIYNILGEKIRTLFNDEMNSGQYKIVFDGSNLASGIYFYRIQAGKFLQTKKMILMK
ncbi:MAG: hypothetical protein A2315_12705 [Ignavibacteria bacterium RIFOXYB2_FULL_35_12]|nr:MAG: hypothetical protein A2058_08830 [Ignavibacteria bacterium GWA2_36_19]OGU57411.1 MAG: hypothetical protein A2X60_16630 [Ignavibacteria bacterium GWF2_35_20]OGU79007.1 MAG: hypothetical protein A2254_01590 [Ignavibacteria bacterium RIFOXYA2_FULL_35_9]OGU88348.1 MAG: hypothetical protein A2492_08665 [Ignavibacteria bacterium RIFOXYC12_FULL_35_11]OGU91581.1 MAG: hypothetical protein A3K31_02705 [Ignavibacteria bacterium RIFOXYA12_FULL_35_25]OGU97875.1 MAG: hypothetical protein A2347_16570